MATMLNDLSGLPRRFGRTIRRELAALRPTARLREIRRIATLVERTSGQRGSRLDRQLSDLDAHLVEVGTAVREQASMLRALRSEAVEQRKMLNVLRARLTSDVVGEVVAFTRERQLGLEQTLQTIIDKDLSFARFGDGEFRLMFEIEYGIRFQPNSPKLRAALSDALTSEPVDGLLLGLPQVFHDRNGSLVWSTVWRDLRPLLHDDVVFGNSHVSRPIAFQDLGPRAVDLWRQVWQDREVCIITGEGSRFELVPALFDNLAGHRYLWSTPTNAFADLDRVLAEVEQGPGADLYLISLGPAGTVLASTLARRGHRAIDIGHISDSYRNVFEGSAWPESRPLRTAG